MQFMEKVIWYENSCTNYFVDGFPCKVELVVILQNNMLKIISVHIFANTIVSKINESKFVHLW